MPDALELSVIYGSVRPHRQGIKAARFLVEACRSRGHQATLIDPLEQQLPLLGKMYKEYARGQAPETLEKLAALFRASDAFIIVSGEYNHSIPPALSNLLDHFLEEYFWRPSGIVCYSAGAFGGVRAAMQFARCSASWVRPVFPRCSRYRMCKTHSTTRAILATQSTMSAQRGFSASSSGTPAPSSQQGSRVFPIERACCTGDPRSAMPGNCDSRLPGVPIMLA